MELSGFVIAVIFVLMAVFALALSWAMCVIAVDWREAGFSYEDQEPTL
jgi:hypothetical protein